MNNADGRVVINFEFPISEVESSKRKIDKILQSLGENAGEDYKKSFTKNADAVKQHAEKTSKEISDKLGKDIKSKVDLNTSDAQERAKKVSELYKQLKDLLKNPTSFKVSVSDADDSINKVKKDIQEVPSDKKVKYTADSFDATRKADEIKRKTDEVPTKHNTTFNATDHTGGVFSAIKSHFDKVNNQGKETHSIFKSVFSANIISNAATNAFGAVRGALGGMIGEAKQYALEQQTMNATWLTLTNSASKGKAMVSQINNMAAAAQNSTHMVDQLSQKFYAINNSAKQTGQLTKAVLTLQDAFGQSDAAVENFGTQFAQMMANGKVSAQDMMSIVNTFPKLKPMLLDYERQIHHDKNMTMSQMSDLMSKGKIKSQDMINVVLQAGKKFKSATGNFTATIPGMKRTIDAQMPRLLQAFEGPLTKMQSPIYGAVSKWVSSKKTASEFDKLGKTVSIGMNNVIKAFGGNKSINVTQTLDNAIKGINKGLQGVFGWVSAHAKDLKTIASSVASIGGQIAKAVWKDFASIITTIGNMFGITAKNGKKSGGAIHVLAEALNWLSKQRWAIHAIAASIVTIATVKSLDHVGGGLFSIGEKGYGAYRKIKALCAGIKGVQDIKDFKKTEQGFYTIGQQAKGAYKWVKSLFGAGKNAGKLTGVLQSVHSAGGFKGLSTAGKIATGVAGAGVVADAGYNAIFKAFQDRHSATKRSQDIGKGIGAGIGGGIGLWFGGPLGAAVGAKVGEVVGKWGGEAVNKFTKGWQSKKPPKSFWSLANLGWSAHSMWNGFTSSVGKTIKWFKKNWREIGSFLTHPVLESIRLLSKNKGFQKWVKKTANDMHKGWKQGVEKSHKVMAKFWSNTAKGWNKMWKSINSNRYVKAFKKGKFFSTALKDMKSRFSAFNKWLSQKWSSTWREVNSNRYVKAFKKGKFFSTALKDIRSRWNSFTSWFGKNWHNFWRSTNKHAHSSWSDTVKNWHSFTKSINTGWKSFKDSFKSSWNGFWHGLENTVKSWGKTIKDDFTGTVNNIIGGFNDVVHALGGKKKTIGFLHFANGTDWRSRYGVPAIVNDAPGDNYREGLIDTDGSVKAFPDKRNLPFWLKPGQDIINGKDMARFFGKPARFATGTVAIVNDKDLFSDSFNKINDTLKGILDESKKTNKKKEKDKDYGSVISNALHKASYTTKSGAKVQWNIVGETIKKLRNTTTRKRKHSKKTSRRTKHRTESHSRERSTSSTSRSNVVVSVTGASKLNSLKRAIRAVTGTHKVKLSIATSGSTKGLKGALNSIGSKKARVSISFKVQNAKVINRIKSQLSKIKNRNAKITITTGKSEKALARISSQFGKTSNSIYSKTRRLGSAVDKSWKHIWSSASSLFSSFSSKQRSNLDKFSDRYIKGWKSLGSGVKSAQSHAMSELENITGKGLNKVLSVINSGIGKINSVIKDFGGNGGALSTISPVKYATGTGYRPITKPTFAVVNDGNDSPETGNREALYRPATGEFGIFNGRNVPVMLNPGDEIFSASETKPFINATHFANGTGYLKHLYDLTKKYFAKPKKTLGSMLNYANSTKGAIGRLATGMFKKADKQALNWWSQLWSMVNNKINDGDLGPASGLLKAVEELGQGKHYSQSKRMSKFFADCSSLVSRALAKYYHVGWSTPNGWALTVAGLWKHAHKISRAEARPGDPVFWLPDTHVGVYAGHGRYYSAYGPNDGGPVGMQAVAPGATFGRFDGLNTEGSKSKSPKIKANNALQKKIRGQVGKGFWKTIQKIAEKYGDNGMAGAFKLGGDIAQRARAIAKALKQAVPGATKNGLAGVIGSWVFESGGLNPAAVNPDGGASGFGQWLGSRKANLMAYARRHGKSWKDPATQINFAVNADGSDSAILKRILRSSGSASELALKFSREWERGGYDAQHASAARSIAGALHGFANGGKIIYPQFATVGEDGPEYVINPAKASADKYLLEAIKDRASRAPQSAVADLSKMLDFNQFRYSASNGWRTRSDAHTNNQVRAVTSNGMKGNGGDIHMVVKLNNKTIAQGVKPILDAQQADQIVIAEGGGSI